MDPDDFSPDEIGVAVTLTRLKFLIPFNDFRNLGFLPPLWGAKRLRSVYAHDRPRTESVIPTACPVIYFGGNLRNISPDPPLLSESSPTSSGGGQGSSSIVAESPQEKELTPDPTSETDHLPYDDDGDDASPGSPQQRVFKSMQLFDLNLTPPDCMENQSPLPNKDEKPRSNYAIVDNASNKTEATGPPPRLKWFRDMQGETPQGCCKAQ